MSLSVVSVDNSNLPQVNEFLLRHEETSQFLLSGLDRFGPKATGHTYSGDYNLLLSNGEVKGVFSLAKGGNLYATAEGDCTDAIYASCVASGIPLKGFLGPWDTLAPIFERHKRETGFTPKYFSKEILYRLLLPGNPRLAGDRDVRLLEVTDVAAYLPLRQAYEQELGLPVNTTLDERKAGFQRTVELKIGWGLVQGNELASMSFLNASAGKIGQVGGVFTRPELRKRGLSKRVMLHQLRDARELHGHEKSILFTGEADVPAQKLYESIGYERIGHFALILG